MIRSIRQFFCRHRWIVDTDHTCVAEHKTCKHCGLKDPIKRGDELRFLMRQAKDVKIVEPKGDKVSGPERTPSVPKSGEEAGS